jgi:hypothetical protein
MTREREGGRERKKEEGEKERSETSVKTVMPRTTYDEQDLTWEEFSCLEVAVCMTLVTLYCAA